MKKILLFTTTILLILILLIPVTAELSYTPTGGDYEFDVDTPLGSAPNVIGSDTYQDIEPPPIPGGLITTAAQTNDTNIILLIGISVISLTSVIIIAIKTKSKKNTVV